MNLNWSIVFRTFKLRIYGVKYTVSSKSKYVAFKLSPSPSPSRHSRKFYHCVRKVYQGVRKVYHGVRKVYHGVRKVYHGVRKVYHGQSSIISHWIDCLPQEQGWISQISLISNYGDNNRQTESRALL